MAKYLCEIHNIMSDETLGQKTPWSARKGETPDISAYMQFTFYELVYYPEPKETFPSTREKVGRFIGVSQHIGDSLTFEILTKKGTIVHRSVVRPAEGRLNRTLHKARPEKIPLSNIELFTVDEPINNPKITKMKWVDEMERDADNVTPLPNLGKETSDLHVLVDNAANHHNPI
jgi:hypothetical protein